MLTLLGKRQSFCDGVSRRNFLKIGALGFGSPCPARSAAGRGDRAGRGGQQPVDHQYLSGRRAVAHRHVRPQARRPARDSRRVPADPDERAGHGNLPAHAEAGLDRYEVRDRPLADRHSRRACRRSDRKRLVGKRSAAPWAGIPASAPLWPSCKEPPAARVPTFVDLTGHTKHGFLGPVYSGFRPDGEGRNESPPSRRGHGRPLPQPEQNCSRSSTASAATWTRSHAMDAMDAFNQRAYGVITSPKLAEALEWEKADAKVREQYGVVEHQENSRFLVAKRLIECGVRIVSFRWGGWDTHGDNFNALRRHAAAARRRLERPDRRPRSSGHARQHDDRDVGRIRPHAAGQSDRGPRPLGPGRRVPSSPAAG